MPSSESVPTAVQASSLARLSTDKGKPLLGPAEGVDEPVDGREDSVRS